MRKLFSRGAGAVAVAVAVALGAAACSADRSGTIVPVSVSIDDCSPATGKTTVTWSGHSTASVRVTYRNSGGDAVQSTWTNVTANSAGSVQIAAPAAALTGFWTVDTVSLAPRKNGGGALFERQFEDCGIVTVQTLPPTSDTVRTNILN
ncbi:MAG: hypothetical protein RL219_2321 [Actinomycetota bacterium]|jgi:hypothetical protein